MSAVITKEVNQEETQMHKGIYINDVTMPIQAKSHAESKSSTKQSVRGRRLALSIGLAGGPRASPGRPYTRLGATGPGPRP